MAVCYHHEKDLGKVHSIISTRQTFQFHNLKNFSKIGPSNTDSADFDLIALHWFIHTYIFFLVSCFNFASIFLLNNYMYTTFHISWIFYIFFCQIEKVTDARLKVYSVISQNSSFFVNSTPLKVIRSSSIESKKLKGKRHLIS